MMKPALGVCYYPEHWAEDGWAEDASRMRETGITWVRIGEFSWSRLEPQEGTFHWAWLDRAVNTLLDAGLKVVMGTPSATPPRWMLDKFPDMLAVGINGQTRRFGSRRHYCFSHEGYCQAAAQMASRMASRYGNQVQAWQIDNEYGCHDTTLSYSSVARSGFQHWLSEKYTTIGTLNQAWGNVFWSMEYADFTEINLPNQTVTEANPSHWLDFYRYTSDRVVVFNQAQVNAIRPHTDAPLIHNYMGRITDFDHFKVGESLDIASWDSYPLGFLEQVLTEESDDWKQRFYRQGDPDFQAFHHDLYRAVGRGNWWVMEQQPGPVNWAAYNPIPLDGMVRLWSWEAIAHGAAVVSYFRWRQAPFAQEQMHAGLLRPDNEPAQASKEALQVADEITQFGEIEQQDAEVAIIFDYPSQWAWHIQPQGQNFDYFRLVFETYRALRRLGLSVDFLPADATDFGTRKLVLIPGLLHWNTNIRQAMENFNGSVLAGPRSGAKNEHMAIPTPLPPNMPGVDLRVLRVASLRPGCQIPLKKGGSVVHWFEEINTHAELLETTVDDQPILVGNTDRAYLGAWLDAMAMQRLMGQWATQAGITTHDMPEGVRQRQFGKHTLITNYNATPTTFGGQQINGADIAFL